MCCYDVFTFSAWISASCLCMAYMVCAKEDTVGATMSMLSCIVLPVHPRDGDTSRGVSLACWGGGGRTGLCTWLSRLAGWSAWLFLPVNMLSTWAAGQLFPEGGGSFSPHFLHICPGFPPDRWTLPRWVWNGMWVFSPDIKKLVMQVKLAITHWKTTC